MPSNTNNLQQSADKLPIPQYYNQQTDKFEAQQGANGASFSINIGSNSIIGNKQIVASAGTHVQLPNNACREVTLIGLSSNTGSIYVGGNNVSATLYGAELAAKDSITLTVSNTNLIWIDASVSGEGVSYVAV